MSEKGFFDQRNPKTDEPTEHLVTLGVGAVIILDGVKYKVTRQVQVHANLVEESPFPDESGPLMP